VIAPLRHERLLRAARMLYEGAHFTSRIYAQTFGCCDFAARKDCRILRLHLPVVVESVILGGKRAKRLRLASAAKGRP
jgi:hypothetical protein